MYIILLMSVVILSLSIGGFGGYLFRRTQVNKLLTDSEAQATKIRQQAEIRTNNLKKEAQMAYDQMKIEIEDELNRQENLLKQQGNRLQKRQETIDMQFTTLKNEENQLNEKKRSLDKRSKKINEGEITHIKALEKASHTSRKQALAEILKITEDSARQHVAKELREAEQNIREVSERKAQKIISLAIQRVTSQQVSGGNSSVIHVERPSFIKQLLDKSGRNLKLFEQLAQVELTVDELENVITVNDADSVKREIARQALEKLLAENRLNHTRIETIFKRTKRSIQQAIKQAGRGALREAKVQGLHPMLTELLGRLEYRTSYGQNQRLHLIETAHLASIMAVELGANVEVARVAGLLHDVGKALTHEVEGPHALIGAETAEECGLDPVIVNAIASHHHEVEQESLEAMVVEAADAISGARPGARRENLESYVNRIEELEAIATDFSGVREAFAIQAGREIRVIVSPDQVDDEQADNISKNIAKQIEEKLQYPGHIAVTVIRETRSVEYAR